MDEYTFDASLTIEVDSEEQAADLILKHCMSDSTLKLCITSIDMACMLVKKGTLNVKEPEAQADWQPIETAPKDGTPIDLWVVFPSGGKRWVNAKWLEEGKHSCIGPADWCSREGFPLHAFIEKPIATHWRSQPEPPK